MEKDFRRIYKDGWGYWGFLHMGVFESAGDVIVHMIPYLRGAFGRNFGSWVM